MNGDHHLSQIRLTNGRSSRYVPFKTAYRKILAWRDIKRFRATQLD
ncbi:hypothetical protein D931_02667 [Enterococcus faecium 13.SD.W.09]|nr:hypothetical protein D931_02667 [Enterococcus faecium 13.SD.W.09]